MEPDLDERGRPVSDEYKRLGASGNQEGIYVRFEPGFGLNVIIGHQYHIRNQRGTNELKSFEKLTLGIDGWEKLCDLAIEWRARERKVN
jgi:hypothetical protein